MQISTSMTLGLGYGNEIASASLTLSATEIEAQKRSELLPEDLDAAKNRASEQLRKLGAEVENEIERLRPAALARKERLAHEAAASEETATI